jgi:hypothetical protein
MEKEHEMLGYHGAVGSVYRWISFCTLHINIQQCLSMLDLHFLAEYSYAHSPQYKMETMVATTFPMVDCCFFDYKILDVGEEANSTKGIFNFIVFFPFEPGVNSLLQLDDQ